MMCKKKKKKKKKKKAAALLSSSSARLTSFLISLNTGSLQYEPNKALSQTNSHASDQSVC